MKTAPTTPPVHYTEVERLTIDSRVDEQVWSVRRARDVYRSSVRSPLKRLTHLATDAAAGGAAKRALSELAQHDWLNED